MHVNPPCLFLQQHTTTKLMTYNTFPVYIFTPMNLKNTRSFKTLYSDNIPYIQTWNIVYPTLRSL